VAGKKKNNGGESGGKKGSVRGDKEGDSITCLGQKGVLWEIRKGGHLSLADIRRRKCGLALRGRLVEFSKRKGGRSTTSPKRGKKKREGLKKGRAIPRERKRLAAATPIQSAPHFDIRSRT